MKKNLIIILLTLLLSPAFGQRQNYGLGLIMDNRSYEAMPRKARLTEKAYQSLPTNSSLKLYCPEAGDQKQDGTCVGWSTAWALRTIIEAKQKNLTTPSEISKIAFSPAFNYYYSTDQNNFSCSTGAHIEEALNSMIDRGVPLYTDFSVPCTQNIPLTVIDLAKKYKIKETNRLFDIDASDDIKISSVKTALSNGNPVAIGMQIPNSFFTAKGCWMPNPGEQGIGGHAMCVIGYDDNKFGGAVEIMNSWGNGWGNDGFIWVKYKDFANYTKYAFEAYPFKKQDPQGITISGSVKLLSSNGLELQVGKNKDLTVKGQAVIEEVSIGDYVVNTPLSSGSKYRLLLSTSQSIYVYVVSSDLTNSVNQLFPFKSESAYLSYSTNEVALPNERSWIQLDNNVGKDFTIIIYSIKELNINDICNKIKNASGSIVEKLNSALLGDLILKSSMTLATDKIRFEAKADQKSVASIIVEINHQ